jgi:hypothetical protein
MKAKNYRIGNLIMFGELRHEMTYHDIRNLYESELVNKVPSGSYKDILLTPEWLIKLGAKKNQLPNSYWISVANLKAELHFETYDNTDEIVTTLISQSCELILDRIKYVHEYQNLYYALTKCELSLSGI